MNGAILSLRERVEHTLRHIDGLTVQRLEFTRPSTPGRVVVRLVAPEFEGMDEGQRQQMVWRAIFDEFGDHDASLIEMILTDAPSEHAA